MSNFKAKMQQIQIQQGEPQTTLGELTALLQTPYIIAGFKGSYF